MPARFKNIFFVNSGSEANDTIVRFVRHYWKLMGKPYRTHFIGRRRGYHGSTMAAASLGGMQGMHDQGGLPLPGFHHVQQPYWYDFGGKLSPEEFGLQAAADAEKKIISRIRGYHGVTIAAGSLTGLPAVHTDFDLPIPQVMHVSCPQYYRYGQPGESEEQFTDRMVKEVEDLIEREGPDTIGAFIAEPVMGSGGVIVPPKGYFEKLGKVFAKHDIRFISDEVICGFGRTGNWFGAQSTGFQPTSVSMAKALTSAYFPLGAITIEEDLYQAMLEESKKIGTFGHGYTYTAHPVGCAVALKAIEIYERDQIIAHVRKVAPVFAKRLKRLVDHPLGGEARSSGLMGAIELVADKKTRQPFDVKKVVGPTCIMLLEKLGVISRSMGDSLSFCPPLIITEDEINEMFDIVETALDQTEAWVRKENLRAA
jgi:4-aminobutyrate--pyruvate transaminase